MRFSCLALLPLLSVTSVEGQAAQSCSDQNNRFRAPDDIGRWWVVSCSFLISDAYLVSHFFLLALLFNNFSAPRGLPTKTTLTPVALTVSSVRFWPTHAQHRTSELFFPTTFLLLTNKHAYIFGSAYHSFSDAFFFDTSKMFFPGLTITISSKHTVSSYFPRQFQMVLCQKYDVNVVGSTTSLTDSHLFGFCR